MVFLIALRTCAWRAVPRTHMPGVIVHVSESPLFLHCAPAAATSQTERNTRRPVPPRNALTHFVAIPTPQNTFPTMFAGKGIEETTGGNHYRLCTRRTCQLGNHSCSLRQLTVCRKCEPVSTTRCFRVGRQRAKGCERFQESHT